MEQLTGASEQIFITLQEIAKGIESFSKNTASISSSSQTVKEIASILSFPLEKVETEDSEKIEEFLASFKKQVEEYDMYFPSHEFGAKYSTSRTFTKVTSGPTPAFHI